jgi:hypothetical protein
LENSKRIRFYLAGLYGHSTVNSAPLGAVVNRGDGTYFINTKDHARWLIVSNLDTGVRGKLFHLINEYAQCYPDASRAAEAPKETLYGGEELKKISVEMEDDKLIRCGLKVPKPSIEEYEVLEDFGKF